MCRVPPQNNQPLGRASIAKGLTSAHDKHIKAYDSYMTGTAFPQEGKAYQRHRLAPLHLIWRHRCCPNSSQAPSGPHWAASLVSDAPPPTPSTQHGYRKKRKEGLRRQT